MSLVPSAPVREIVLDLFKDLAWDALVKAALKKFLMRSAFLSWGPVAAFVTHYVLKFSEELYEGLSLFVDVKAIAFRNGEFKDAFIKSSTKLMVIAKSAGIESIEFKEARVENRKSLSDLVRFDVAREH